MGGFYLKQQSHILFMCHNDTGKKDFKYHNTIVQIL